MSTASKQGTEIKKVIVISGFSGGTDEANMLTVRIEYSGRTNHRDLVPFVLNSLETASKLEKAEALNAELIEALKKVQNRLFVLTDLCHFDIGSVGGKALYEAIALTNVKEVRAALAHSEKGE